MSVKTTNNIIWARKNIYRKSPVTSVSVFSVKQLSLKEEISIERIHRIESFKKLIIPLTQNMFKNQLLCNQWNFWVFACVADMNHLWFVSIQGHFFPRDLHKPCCLEVWEVLRIKFPDNCAGFYDCVVMLFKSPGMILKIIIKNRIVLVPGENYHHYLLCTRDDKIRPWTGEHHETWFT